jgi:hypothetical protein
VDEARFRQRGDRRRPGVALSGEPLERRVPGHRLELGDEGLETLDDLVG